MSYCIAKRDDGAVCHKPADVYDPLRMGHVCGAHAPSEPAPEVWADVRLGTWGMVIARDPASGTFTAVARDTATVDGGLLIVGNATVDEAIAKAYDFTETWSGSGLVARSLRALAKFAVATRAN